MITQTSYTVDHGKKIDIFDGVLPLIARSHIYSFCQNSMFRIGWGEADIPERKARDYFLYSSYSEDDVNALGILPYINNSPVQSLIDNLKLSKTVLNLGVPSDVYHAHTHLESKVVLYYVNQDWYPGWHGETMFYSEDLNRIQYTSQYTPGRIIVFDASIPHTTRPQSSIAAHHRFSLSMFYAAP